MKTKMYNIKKVHFSTKFFKNTIFIMYDTAFALKSRKLE